ncbi:InlB B-repeat-containing protein [Candidatus Saccharibacteria bacterium]|nr:InlB B-repeat-containing protein [Candidatus Saccharibacteria bacterium]
MKVGKKVLSAICVLFLTFFCILGFSSNSVFAVATQSTISMSIQSGSLSVNLMPAAGGTFGESGNATLSVTTDNYTGYKLSLSMGDGASLLNENGDEITSISSAISNQTFSTSSAYNNKWGIKPNQYISSSGGIDTVVNNTDFLPAPSDQGLVIDKTSAANSIANTYTLSFGTRVDMSLPAGTYTNTYVLTAVANSIVFNVTYDDNTTDTVTNMPTPNPQPTTIDGGTPAEDSYVTLSDVTPVRNDKKFAGWCDVATGTDVASGDDTCSGTLYKAGDELPVDQTAGPNITLYAVWVDTLFPVVWNQMGACEFHGATNGNITGSACSDYHNVRFIDTGVALYSQANYLKDFEIHFTLDHYLPSEQVNYFGSEDNGQQTFVNDKLGSHAADGKAPGVTVRRATSNIDFNSKFGDEQEKKEIPYAQVHDVSMFRLDNKIYYSYDGGPLVFLQDITGFNQQFDLTTWFGAYPRDDCDGSQGPCTNAKRIPEATMSNMYIRLGEYSDEDVHTISFKANDGTTTTVATYLIKDGNAVTTIPTAPVYADHYFQGWFTDQSGGTEVTSSTIPDASADYYAHWLGSVAIADIDNPVITLEPDDTETIVVNNASELEPYTFSSSNDNVATVNQTTGEITAIGPGTAIITMTGATSGETQTIDVTVTGQVIHVSFDSQGGTPASYTWDVGDGSSFSTLPAPTKEDHEFAGWWTGTNGTGTELTTSTVFDENTPTQYYANWTEMVYVCRIATSLHTETCSKSNGNGCRKAGWASDASNTIIEYGHLVSKAEETHGAAYDCDVDYDGTYDSENERFYYFGTENGNAKFIHYKNMPNNATDELNPSVAYNAAIALLPNYELDQQNPLVPVWDNPHLITHTTGDYAGKAARFMTYPEITGGLWSGGTNHITPSDPVSTYLFEQSNFATNNATDGIWLEEQPSFKNRIQTNSLTLTHGSTSANAARATIDVPVEYVQPYVETETYDITFDPHNETSSWTETIDAGDDLSDVYPATNPSYANHLFQGWFTAATGGSQISSSTEPSADITYHAQWKGTVALATVAENSITVATGGTATVSVTNAADLEGFTFSSSDPNVATIDSSTGVITPVAAGTTNISITGATSSTTNQIATVTVTAPVVQYTVYFNPHNGEPNSSATVTAGQQIGSSNIPADPTPSGTDEVFMGWFTAATGGTAVDGTTTPSADGETYHAQYKKIVCKLETSSANLHTASNNTYGQIANSSTPHGGDAYNCDVDYDGNFDDDTERFYYLTQDGNGNAVLSAWNNYMSTAWGIGDSSENMLYANALNALPSNASGAWDNPGLVAQDNNKAARLMKVSEMTAGCGVAVDSGTNPMDACDYLMENTGYDGGGRSAYWVLNEGDYLRFHSNSHKVVGASSTATSAARPAIVVPYKLIEKFTPTLLDVTNAIIANNDLTVPVGGNITIQVSNSAALEPYTFSSQDSTIATVDSSTGVVTGVSVGTVNIIMTGTNSGLTKTLEVDVLSSVQQFTVTFNTNGGILDNGASVTRSVDDGDGVGALPTASKTNYKFFGWYADDGTFYDEVYPETVVYSDTTYYAKWEEDTSSFPIVWSEINECTFTGTAVTGTYCGNTSNSLYYIDTNLQLFTAANYNKDFEVGFTITEYDPASQLSGGGNQATFVSTKKEDSTNNYPGFVVRRYSGTNFIEITSRWKGDAQSLAKSDIPYATTKTIKIQKRKVTEQGNDYYRIYYSINGGAWTLYEDVTNKTHFEFNTKIWFGGAEAANGTSPMRPLIGKLTDMYVKLGVDSEYLVNLDPNDGTLPSGAQSSYTITAGDPVGALPTPTAPSANYTFGGWYDGNTLVTDGTQYVPTSNVTLVAHWVYNSSDTPVVFDVSNDATRGYKTIINNWVGSPVNITTFNKNTTTINDSTWGDTSELSEVQFWSTLKNNFETNNCLKPSYGDAATTTPNPTAWTNGSVDCSKPDEYDTLIGSALNVYLYNNQTLGAQVTYAEADDGIIRNLIPGNTYKWVKDGDNTVYGYVTVTSNGSDHGTRWVDAGQIRNVRDLGGLPADTDDDGTVDAYVDYGRLFRGEKLWTAPATNLTNLGITKEYDVGDPAEYSGNTKLSSYQNDQVIHYNFDYNSGDENNATSNYMRAWTAVTNIMEDIVNENNPQNIYFHCRVGADRTGTVAYLLEGLLGVPDEERYQEYELTHLSGLFDRTRYYKQKTSTNNLKFVFMMEYVQTTQDIIDWYMHNPNADSDLIDDFRAAMTTPIQSQSPSPAPGGQGNSNSSQQTQSLMNVPYTSSPNVSSQVAESGASETISASSANSNLPITDNSDSNYTEPLGVYEETSDSGIDAAGLAIAAAAVAGAGGLTYAYASSNKDND